MSVRATSTRREREELRVLQKGGKRKGDGLGVKEGRGGAESEEMGGRG